MRSWQIETTCKHGIQTRPQWDDPVCEFGVEEYYGWNADAPSSFQRGESTSLARTWWKESQSCKTGWNENLAQCSRFDWHWVWHRQVLHVWRVGHTLKSWAMLGQRACACPVEDDDATCKKLSSTMLTSFLSQEILIATKDVNIWTHQKIDVLDESETAPIANHQVGDTLIFPGRVDEIWQTLNLWNEVVDCRSWAYCCKSLYCHQRCIEHFRHNNIMSSIFQLNGSQQYIKWTLNWAQQQMFWMKSDTGALAPVTYYWS